MMRRQLFLLLLCCLTFAACKNNNKRILTSATGTIYELLIVADNQYWNGTTGDSLREVFEEPMVGLPQVEPYFNISQAPTSAFDNMLMPSRNILIIDVNSEKYTQTKIGYSTDLWSHPQAVVKVSCPDKETLADCISKYGRRIRKYFVDQELSRQGVFYETYCNHEASREIMKKFGVDILIPNDMVKIQDDTDFYWVCDARGQARKDIVIYSYPYTDPNTFTLDYLIHKRDSVLGKYVTDSQNGHMITERNHIPPVLDEFTVNKGGYCAEVRGLWKMKDGLAMGGPFVSHSRVDEINHRVITVECFVYAAGMKKRNTLRQMEAVLYTMKLQQEINELDQVVVTAE